MKLGGLYFELEFLASGGGWVCSVEPFYRMPLRHSWWRGRWLQQEQVAPVAFGRFMRYVDVLDGRDKVEFLGFGRCDVRSFRGVRLMAKAGGEPLELRRYVVDRRRES